jgi:hypothetical protein
MVSFRQSQSQITSAGSFGHKDQVVADLLLRCESVLRRSDETVRKKWQRMAMNVKERSRQRITAIRNEKVFFTALEFLAESPVYRGYEGNV